MPIDISSSGINSGTYFKFHKPESKRGNQQLVPSFLFLQMRLRAELPDY